MTATETECVVQFTGINAIVLFAPFLFQGLGPAFIGEYGGLLASMIVGGVQVSLIYSHAFSHLTESQQGRYKTMKACNSN